ncbi:MAG: nitrile hydratase subunit alpha [Gemmatimonadetes bacterium]|jgi:hypothetical protein|nr:nitrile hydratase subunit alpha [Gemmatimonadota bacterium]MBT7862002.1 nitrile hydratase subunit alpha [Gemmatimonadota bacterium]
MAHDDHDHHHPPHPKQPDEEETPFGYHQLMAQALEELLVEKGVVTPDQLRRGLEEQSSRHPANGTRLVAKAWKDPAFDARVREDVNAAARELGLNPGDIPIRAVYDTDAEKNVIVCTLCSCYPTGLLGESPDWYKSRAYRSRVVREPRAVLQEFGTRVPEEVEIVVHDSTAELRYIVVPQRPAGTESLNEDQLVALLSRDCLIGTTLPQGT